MLAVHVPAGSLAVWWLGSQSEQERQEVEPASFLTRGLEASTLLFPLYATGKEVTEPDSRRGDTDPISWWVECQRHLGSCFKITTAC